MLPQAVNYAFIEIFNGRLRDELLNETFNSVATSRISSRVKLPPEAAWKTDNLYDKNERAH